jgi:signal transduction histidine kinase
MTIRVRLTTWYVVVGTATLVVLAVIVWLQYAGALRRSLDEVLQARASAAQELVEVDPSAPPDVGTLERGVFLVVFAPDGSVSSSSPRAPTFVRPPLGLSSVQAGPASGDELYAMAASGGQTVVAGSSVADIDRNLDSLARTLMVVGAAGAVALVIGGWWLAGRALAPVRELTRQADSIGSGALDRRLPEPRQQDELGALARTLNRMLGRVEDAARRQRDFVLGASHDLRTPLATLRTELELALVHPADHASLVAAVEGAHADAVRLSELANGLLRLAAAEPDGRPLDIQEVRLRALVRDSVDLVEKAGAERAITIGVQAPDVAIRVDRARLVQAIVNLLGNALRFAPRDTSVEVHTALDSSTVGRVLRVDVLDRGPGVAPDVRGTLFEPFARPRSAGPSGLGLGLATAAAAVHAHGGAIGYEDRPDGGSDFWFWVPA